MTSAVPTEGLRAPGAGARLDEPTTFLDLRHQIDVLDLVAALHAEAGRTVVMVLHDLGQAARYADHLVVLKDGWLAAAGPPAEVLDAELVRSVFDVDCRVIPDPETSTPLVIPKGSAVRHPPAPARPVSAPPSRTQGRQPHMAMRYPLRRTGRFTAALLTVVVSATALAACGGGSSSGTDDPAQAGAAAGAFPRTVATPMGEVKIPRQPGKVVVLDTGELDDVTLLGITPVGAVAPHFKTEGGFPAYLKGELGGTEDVGPLLEPNLELIASLRPDLILSSKVRHEKIYGKLSAIAPTVFTETTGGVWKQNLTVHAKALGLEKQAAAKLTAYEKRARALGSAVEEKNGGTMPSASVVRFIAGPTRLYQSNSYSGVVLDDIGLKRPASQVSDDPDVTMKDVSPEQIDRADADLIFVTTADTPEKTQQKQVVSNPLWKDLDAVKNGGVHTVPDETWMSGIGVQAAEQMLADVAGATGVQLPKE